MERLRRLKRLFWFAFIAVALFVPAGTLAWPGGWLFLVLFLAGAFGTMGWLKRRDPELYRERLRRFGEASDQPRWDKLFGLVMGVTWYAWIAAMGFEARGAVATSPVLLGAGAAVMISGYLLAAASLAANSFAATVVRLQTERRQRVIDTGPYALVRHPMYTGSLAVHIGTALLLGARWGLLGLPVLAFLLGARAVLEERLLREGLSGYAEYTARVRWRLIPGLF